MDLHEAPLLQELTEESADTGLNAEDGLVGDGLRQVKVGWVSHVE